MKMILKVAQARAVIEVARRVNADGGIAQLHFDAATVVQGGDGGVTVRSHADALHRESYKSIDLFEKAYMRSEDAPFTVQVTRNGVCVSRMVTPLQLAQAPDPVVFVGNSVFEMIGVVK